MRLLYNKFIFSVELRMTQKHNIWVLWSIASQVMISYKNWVFLLHPFLLRAHTCFFYEDIPITRFWIIGTLSVHMRKVLQPQLYRVMDNRYSDPSFDTVTMFLTIIYTTNLNLQWSYNDRWQNGSCIPFDFANFYDSW
jgi:hypothetical protein